MYKRIVKKVKHQLMRMSKRRLEIFLYHFVSDKDDIFINSGHNVRPGVFKEQIKYLNDHFKILPLRQFRQAFSSEQASDSPFVCVCFDDGYLNNLTEAYPILEELKVPATVFICPSILDNQDLLWRDKIRYLIEKNLVDHFLEYLKNSKNSGKYRFEMLKKRTFYKWSKKKEDITDMSIQGDLDQYFLKNRIQAPHIAEQHDLFMKRSDLVNREYMDFGNHTWSHPMMEMLSYEEQRAEIVRTHRYLTEAECSPFALALPFSQFNSDTMKICKEIGYDCLLTTESQSNTLRPQDDDVSVLHRWMAPLTLKKLKAIL